MKINRLVTFAAVLAGVSGPVLAADPVANTPVRVTKGPAAPADLPFFFVNDNKLSLSYQFTATDPGVSGKFGKTVVNFTHFDVWAYGTNFLSIDALKSANHDPAAPCGNFLAPTTGCTGATEFYGLFRSTFGLNQIFKTKAFSMGPLDNVSLEIGADAETENNFLAPAKRDVVAGLEFTLGLPYHGHFNISPLYYKEVNHNTFVTPAFAAPGIPSGNTNFNGTWALEMNYAMELGFLPPQLPITFSGYSNFYGPKGTGVGASVPGTTKTAIEFNSEQRLTLDVGQMVMGKKYAHTEELWVGYRYWQNKFGLNHSTSPVCTGAGHGSCTESSMVTGLSVTF